MKRENSVLSPSQISSLQVPQSAGNSRNEEVLKQFKLESIRHFEYRSCNKLLLYSGKYLLNSGLGTRKNVPFIIKNKLTKKH